MLAATAGQPCVVFGTVLLGRMQSGAGADRALGMFINTLPLRVEVNEHSVSTAVRAVHQRLAALLGHEHASLALAQRCSAVAAPSPLFSSVLNYRHSAARQSDESAWQGIEFLTHEGHSHYPLTLSINDLGEGFDLSVLSAPRSVRNRSAT